VSQDEAFALWTEKWANIYEKGSRSREIVEEIADNYFLVNLVDNEFPNESILWKVLDEMLDTAKQQISAKNGIETEIKIVNGHQLPV